MGQITYRGNLASATWPLLAYRFGRTVMISGNDQNFVRQTYSPEDPDKDIGVPQVYYLHNVMPTPYGYGSIGYEKQSLSASTAPGLDDVHLVYSLSGDKAYICMSPSGLAVFDLTTRRFTLSLVLAPAYIGAAITTAIVNGVCYVYVAGLSCYTYDAGAFTPVTLSGLTASDILGICAANGYLIAYSADTVVWSSTIDPTDFVPSLITGAGGGSVQNVKGNIVTVVPTNTGLAICSQTNIVCTIYTGNARYPYQFVEVTGSGGLSSAELFAYDTNSGNNFAYTSFGMQIITSNRAQLVFPDVTDFLAGQAFEDFDELTKTFTVTELFAAMSKKLVLISARYLVISYGKTTLTHALVYDLASRRWGKLKIDHTDCFEYELLDQTTSDRPKKSIGFLTDAGDIYTVNFDQESTLRNGVILLGKFQYVRQRNMYMEKLVIETQTPTAPMTAYVYNSLDGKTLGSPIVLAYSYAGQYSKEWPVHKIGLNQSFLFTGAFNLTSIILSFFPAGINRGVSLASA